MCMYTLKFPSHFGSMTCLALVCIYAAIAATMYDPMDVPIFQDDSDTEMSDDEAMPPLVSSDDEQDEKGFADWDLEMELLSRPGLGGTQQNMREMAKKNRRHATMCPHM